MRVLGIDPGTVRTGLGLISRRRGTDTVEYIATIFVEPKIPLAERLSEIYTHLTAVLDKEQPSVIAVETCFYHKDFKAAVKLGEARALALLAAAERKIEIAEYPPARIKQAVCGNGRASKQQMQYMVRQLLRLDKVPQEDAADALSVALCHLHMSQMVKNIHV